MIYITPPVPREQTRVEIILPEEQKVPENSDRKRGKKKK